MKLLTAEDVAERFRVPVSHIYRLSRQGDLPTIRLGRYYRYSLEALEAFERDGGCTERNTA